MADVINPGDAEFLDERSPDDVPRRAQDPYESNPRDRPPGENPEAGIGSHIGLAEDTEQLDRWQDEQWLLQKAQDLYTTSTDYLEANITNTWETNLAHFHGQHAPDSAYRQKNWKRSRIFRPKTRSMTKAHEAALAVAAFSSEDYVHVKPEDPRNEEQVVSAEINRNLLRYRLKRRMPWFLTAVGAYQDTKVYGVAISHQYWSYIEDEAFELQFDKEGNILLDEQEDLPLALKNTVVREDKLCCDLVAPENFRFDPVCDWRDPAGTSPYLIYLMPLYAAEVLERMERIDPKTGQPMWRPYSLAEITATRRESFDRTRQAREGRERVDPANENRGSEYDLVWARMYIVRVDGEDLLYWTLGGELLLTLPVPLVTAYPHLQRGERPFVIGFSSLEAHRNYPAGDVEQSSGLQTELNAIANQRMDNVKLVLNKRYFVRRGSQVDLDALIRNVPGGGVMMNDPDKDVKTTETRDVTSSSYEEQNRLAVEMDELTGTFSQGSVQSNRQLNETVGGIDKMSASAGAVQDYSIQIFMMTWMEPTLKQLLKLIQFYETDQVLLAIAANNSQLWQRYGTDQVTDELLRQDLTLEVNVGIGNTDPVRRVERLVFAVNQVINMPGMAERVKASKISDEIFGALGYKDSSRFFLSDDEMEKKAQEEQGQQQPPPEIMVQFRELEIRDRDNQMRNQRELQKLAQELELGYAKLALDRELKLSEVYSRLGIDEMRIKATRDATALRETNKITELNMKRATGSGI